MDEKRSRPDQESGGKQDQKFAQYKMLFDQWTNTRAERTEYNKWYTNLLFIETLVAVLTAVLGAKTDVISLQLTRGLLVLVFVAAAVISFTWFLKLITLRNLIYIETEALKAAERDGLSPFAAVTREEDTVGDYLGVNEESPSWRFLFRRWALDLNYFALPIIIMVLFAFAAVISWYWAPNLIGAAVSATNLTNLTTNVTHLTTNVTNLTRNVTNVA